MLRYLRFVFVNVFCLTRSLKLLFAVSNLLYSNIHRGAAHFIWVEQGGVASGIANDNLDTL